MTPSMGPVAAEQTLPCQICHARPARPDGAICWVCLGSERADPPPVTTINPVVFQVADADHVICPRCNKPHQGFLINGRGKCKICKDCITAQRNATWIKNRANHKRSYREKTAAPKPAKLKTEPAPAAPEPAIVKGPDADLHEPCVNYLLLDFSDHPELLQKIKDLARDQFRAPGQQILWIIREVGAS